MLGFIDEEFKSSFGYFGFLIDKHLSRPSVCLTQISGSQHRIKPNEHRAQDFEDRFPRCPDMSSPLMSPSVNGTGALGIFMIRSAPVKEMKSSVQMIARPMCTREFIAMVAEMKRVKVQVSSVLAWRVLYSHWKSEVGREVSALRWCRMNILSSRIIDYLYTVWNGLLFANVQWNVECKRSSQGCVELFLCSMVPYRCDRQRRIKRKRTETNTMLVSKESAHICSRIGHMIHRRERERESCPFRKNF